MAIPIDYKYKNIKGAQMDALYLFHIDDRIRLSGLPE